MATFRQRGGRWQARVQRNGYPDVTKTFSARQDAEKWARSVEREQDTGAFIHRGEAERTTLADLLDRYGKEISPKHKGHREELWKIGVIKRDKIAQYSLVALTPKIVADYRDRRLKAVAESTVRHELNAISAAYKVASREWGIAVTNPVSLIKRPSASNERKRRVSAEEVEAITPVTITQYDGLTTAQLIEWALCDLGDSDELGLALLLRLQEVQDELDMLKAGREAALDDAIEEFRKH